MRRRFLSVVLALSVFTVNGLQAMAVSEYQDIIVMSEEEVPEGAEQQGENESSEEEAPGDFDAENGEDSEDIVVLSDDSLDEGSEEAADTEQSEEIVESEFDAFGQGTQVSNHATGYRSLESRHSIESINSGLGENGFTANEYLEPYYVTPSLPDLEDQGNYGTCWAFSAMSMAEISIMNQEISGIIDIDELSKLHLAYFSYNSVVDPLEGTEGDVNASGEPGRNLLNLGGNLSLAQNVMAGWTGAASESDLPYEKAAEIERSRVDESLCYLDTAHLKNYYEEEYNAFDLAPIKRLIKKCGTVGMSFYAENAMYGGASSGAYNREKNAYYSDFYNWPNHAITVVGWDDNFSADNFNKRPPADGAWLVRNSWTSGSFNDASSWCYDGYFWMSYYENTIDIDVHAFEFDSADNYDNCYQYDGGMFTGVVNAYKAANVFTAKAPYGSDEESLKAVAFYTPNSNVDYTITIYKDLENPEDPESGELCYYATTTGKTDYAGFYTVALEEPVLLPVGCTYSVVITLEKEDEYCLSIGTEAPAYCWFISETSAKPGQSFIQEPGYEGWKDYGAFENANLRIKAYTDDVIGGERVQPESISISNVDGKLELGVYQSFRAKAAFAPENTTNKKLKWISEDPEIATVSGGVVYGVSKGETVITAVSAENELVSTSFAVKVKDVLLGISIEGPLELEVGAIANYKVVTVPEGMELLDSVIWTSSDPKVIKIDSDGTAKGVGVGYATLIVDTGELRTEMDVAVCPQSSQNLKAVVDEKNSIRISWESTSEAEYYEIMRKEKTLKGEDLTSFEDVYFEKGKSGRATYSFVDDTFKDDYSSRIVEYRVYAIKNWVESYQSVSATTFSRILLDPSGGVLGKNYVLFTPEYDPDTDSYGTYGSLPIPTKKGYSFDGWSEERGEQIIVVNSSRVHASDPMLYAAWSPISYKLHFEANREEAGGEVQDVICQYDSFYSIPENSYITDSEVSFIGWNARADGTGRSYEENQLVANLADVEGQVVTFYAQWETPKYTVFFDTAMEEGGSYVTPRTVNSGEKLEKPNNPIRKGHKFDGWYKVKPVEGIDMTGEAFDFENTTIDATSMAGYIDKNNEITLYAKWVTDTDSAYIKDETIQDVVKTLVLDKKSVKLGYGNSVTIRATTVLPVTASNKINWVITDKNKVIASYTEGYDKYGVPYISVVAASGGKGTATITANPVKKGGKTAKCTISVGNSVSSMTVAGKGGASTLAAGKTLQMAVTFNGGDKSSQPTNKDVVWSIIDEDGQEQTSTEVASISAKGVLKAYQEGVIRVKATSTTDSDPETSEKYSAECVVAAYIPLKKAELSAKSIVLAPNGEYELKLKLTPAVTVREHENYVTGSSFAQKMNGEPSYSSALSSADEVAFDEAKLSAAGYYMQFNTIGGEASDDGTWSCTIKALNNTTSKPMPVSISFTPFGAKKATTLSFTVAVSDKKVSRITLSPKKVSIGKGAAAMVSADLYPIVPIGEDSTLIWSIEERYRGSIEFVVDGSDEGCYEVTTGTSEADVNAVKIRARDDGTMKKLSARFKVSTATTKAGGKPSATTTCNVSIGNKATAIALFSSGENKTNHEMLLAVKKNVTIKPLVLAEAMEAKEIEAASYNTLNKKAKASNSKVKWEVIESYDVYGRKTAENGVVSVGQNGKITAVANGSAVVRVTSQDDYLGYDEDPYYSCITITTYSVASKITLDKSKANVQVIEKEDDPDSDILGRYDAVTAVIEPYDVYTNPNDEDYPDMVTKQGQIKWTIEAGAGDQGIISLFVMSTSELVGSGDKELKQKLMAARAVENYGNFITSQGESIVIRAESIGTVKLTAQTLAVDSNGKPFASASCVVTVTKAEVVNKISSDWSEENIPVIKKPTGDYIDITEHGAIPGDDKDDTLIFRQVINGAIAESRYNGGKDDPVTIYVPQGEYNISIGASGASYDCYGIDIDMSYADWNDSTAKYKPTAGLNIIMDKNAILKVAGTNRSEYGVIAIRGGKYTDGDTTKTTSCKVKISGGQIYGEKDLHIGNNGEGGHGIDLEGAADVTIENMRIYDNWGDGIYVGTRAWAPAPNTKPVGCRNITIKNCEIFGNRRNDMSVVDLGIDEYMDEGLTITNCYMHDAHGTAPQCALCIEPNDPVNGNYFMPSEFKTARKIYIKKTILESYKKTDNNYPAVLITAGNKGYVAGKDIKFEGCTIIGPFLNQSGEDVIRNYVPPVTTKKVIAKSKDL